LDTRRDIRRAYFIENFLGKKYPTLRRMVMWLNQIGDELIQGDFVNRFSRILFTILIRRGSSIYLACLEILAIAKMDIFVDGSCCVRNHSQQSGQDLERHGSSGRTFFRDDVT
jgi:hypothetical protein